jgi:chain length determinant protein tyrosine kinase EpsG
MIFSSKATTAPPATSSNPPEDVSSRILDRSIGEIIREARGLGDAEIDRILAFQRKRGVRFGEAAIALGLASHDDVVWALSQQFHYPYAPGEGLQLHEELVTAIDPFSELSEAFRELRSQFLMGVLAPGRPRSALAVLSPDVGDGKTFIAANIAISFSQLGGRTLLVDADMRTPRQHELFGVSNRVGLSSVLSGRTEESVIHPVPNLPSLYVMPVGTVPPNPLELVQRPAFGILTHELLSKFDHVVVDTPAACHGADARVIAAKSGAALLVGRRGRSRMTAMQGLIKSLGSIVPMAGIVINEY